jgi:copper homeostasis protein
MKTDPPILIEACVDSVESALAAERGGAGRVELCADLHDAGTTPSAGMIAACAERLAIPVFVIVRPRGGDFVASDAELDVMRRDVRALCGLGARGVVLGLLARDGEIDVERMRVLIDDADGLEVTFHRAFDHTRDLGASLDTLASLGVARVLTSGGAATALEGAESIAARVRRGGDRIAVMAGGGVRESHVRELVDRSGVRELHVRGTRVVESEPSFVNARVRLRKPLPADEWTREETDEARVRSIVKAALGPWLPALAGVVREPDVGQG